MSDFSSDFWAIYIALITVVSMIACGVLLYAYSTRRAATGEQSDTTGHTWDEDLSEWNNPLPRWWMWLFYITIVFGLVYLVLYPGLGNYAGVLGWSSKNQYDDEQKQAAAQFGPLFDKYLRAGSQGRGGRSGGARDRSAPVSHELLAVPRLGRGRRQGLSEPARQRLALRRGTRDHQSIDHQRPQRRDAADGRGGGRRRGQSKTSRTTCSVCPGARTTNCARRAASRSSTRSA